MNELITPELSDEILNFLIEKVDLGDYEEFKSHDFPRSDQVTVDVIDVLLDDLREKGLIEILTRGHSGYDYTYEISINKTAVDFQQHGGFLGQDVALKNNLRKLLNELSELPEETSARIRSIVTEIEQYLVRLR
jgi:hypothetical protein